MRKSNYLLSSCVILISALALYLLPIILKENALAHVLGWVDYVTLVNHRADHFAQAWQETARYFNLTLTLAPLFLVGHGLAHLISYSDWRLKITSKFSQSNTKDVFISLVSMGVFVCLLFVLPVSVDGSAFSKIAPLYHPAIAPVTFSASISGIYYSAASLILAISRGFE